MIALQFLSVAFAFLYGLMWIVSAFILAWSRKSRASDSSLFVRLLIGTAIWSVGVFLAFIYGWLPA